MLYEAIGFLYPDTDFLIDVIIRDDSDGSGEYIAHWGRVEKQPTDDELQQAYDDFVADKDQKDLDQQATKDAAAAARNFHKSIAGKTWTDQDLENAVRGAIDRLAELDLNKP